MAPSDAQARLLAFFGAAVPELVFLEGDEGRTSLPKWVLLASASEAALPPARDRVVVSIPLGASGAEEALRIGIAGSAPSAHARAVLDSISGADRDAEPTEPLDAASGAVLYAVTLARQAKRVLEIGTGVGASTTWLASAMASTGGQVTTVERDSSMQTRARKNLHSASLLEHVDLRLGEASRVVPRLNGRFDLVLFDEDPEDRVDDLMLVLQACAPRALLASPGGRRHVTGLSVYNATVRSHPDVEGSVDLATGSGLTLSLLRAPRNRPRRRTPRR
jgi:predicted O-methyltransferase YrrM